MKKILLAFAMIFVFAVGAKAQAPENFYSNTTYLYPWGAASTITLKASQATDTINVINNSSKVILATSGTEDTLHQNTTLTTNNVMASGYTVLPGALLIVEIKVGAKTSPYTVTWGTGFAGDTFTAGTISKTYDCLCWYDGTNFLVLTTTKVN